jgi:hypothetical protein
MQYEKHKLNNSKIDDQPIINHAIYQLTVTISGHLASKSKGTGFECRPAELHCFPQFIQASAGKVH